MDVLDRDYQKDALNLLLPQFDKSENLRNMLISWLEPTIEWQRVVKELYSAYDILDDSLGENTESRQLELIGELLNVSRDGDNDKRLRERILAQIAINSADGTGDSFHNMMTLMLGEGVRFEFSEVPYAPQVNVTVFDPQTAITSDLVKAILSIGVLGNFLTVEDVDSILFFPVEVRADGSLEPEWVDPKKSGILSDVESMTPEDMSDVTIVADVTYFGI